MQSQTLGFKCVVVGTLLILLFPSPFLNLSSYPITVAPSTHPISFHPRAMESTPPLATSSSNPIYDEQIGITFVQTFASLAYNVTAIEQQESDGYGPAYLLNGLGDGGYWYQVGVSWNWCGAVSGTCTGYIAGFNMVYEVFDTNAKSVYPANGGGGLERFSGPVNQGDSVLLNLYFSGGNVLMYAKDWNTRAFASQSFSANGSTQFEGLSTASNSKGFFTGLMTEWYHEQPFYSNVERVEYTDPAFGLSSAIMWIDEFNANTTAVIFGQSSGILAYNQPTTVKSFLLEGATEYSDAYFFVTGPLLIALTLSYSVVGGGSGYSGPVLTYQANGQVLTASLGTSPTTYQLDYDTTWSVSSELGGYTAGERWYSNQTLTNVALTSFTYFLVYEHQYRLDVVGGDKGVTGVGWYKAGSSALAFSAGAYGRNSGEGSRVVSYSIDGGQAVRINPQLGQVSVSVVMNTQHLVTFNSVNQFQLSLDTNAAGALSSLTRPSIPGDAGWYDVGMSVTGVFLNVWNASALGSRYAALTLTLDRTQKALTRSGTGTFEVGIIMTAPHSVAVGAVKQYTLAVTGGLVLSLSPGSPTKDSWYDDQSTVTVVAAYSWESVGFSTRLNLVSYSLGSTTSDVPRRGSGGYNIPIQMAAPQNLTLNGEKQYFVSFSFWDASKSVSLYPEAFNLTSTKALQQYNSTGFWADDESRLSVTKVIWEGTDVRPLDNASYDVSQPASIVLSLRVYDAKLQVVDLLGLPVADASVELRLANGTTLTQKTGSDGSIDAGLVPLGTYQGTVSFLGLQSSISGLSSSHPVVRAGVLLSYSTVGVLVGVVLLVALGAYLLRRKKS